MRKYSSLGIGIVISVFLLIAICLFNFKLINIIPKELKTDNIKLVITWINNLLGISFFINVWYFSFVFIKNKSSYNFEENSKENE